MNILICSTKFRSSQSRWNAPKCKNSFFNDLKRLYFIWSCTKSIDWRRKNRIDTILKEFKSPDVLLKYFSAGQVGQDKRLNPRKQFALNYGIFIPIKYLLLLVWILRFGLTDIRGIFCSAKKKEFIMHIITLFETCIRKVYAEPYKYQRNPGAMVQATIIFDMKGFSMQHISCKPGICTNSSKFFHEFNRYFLIIAMEAIIQILQIYEANYPEILHKAFVINGNFASFINTIWFISKLHIRCSSESV